jgi:acetate---CoA ligase (ADP-forming)
MFASAGESLPLVRDVLLHDGATLRLQAPTPADYDDIKEFFDDLSPESRYLRFHGYGRTDIAARAAVEAGGVDRFTLIARHDGSVVAVAGFDGLREPRAAEVAFAVADDWQGRGAGTRMLEQLAEIAADRGITRFDAEVMFSNRAMVGVFEGAGFAVTRRGSFGELTVSLDITPTEAVLERIDERDHFAVVASLRPLLAPSSIAVVGLQRHRETSAARCWRTSTLAAIRGWRCRFIARGFGWLEARRSQPRRAGGRCRAGDHRRRGRRATRVCRRGGHERSEGAVGAPRQSRRRWGGVGRAGRAAA